MDFNQILGKSSIFDSTVEAVKVTNESIIFSNFEAIHQHQKQADSRKIKLSYDDRTIFPKLLFDEE
jgi:hypothetical protein